MARSLEPYGDGYYGGYGGGSLGYHGTGGNRRPIVAQGYTGKVKFYLSHKNYGFIVCESTEEEVFVHSRNIIKREPFLYPGEALTFDLVRGKKGLEAVNVINTEFNPLFHGMVQHYGHFSAFNAVVTRCQVAGVSRNSYTTNNGVPSVSTSNSGPRLRLGSFYHPGRLLYNVSTTQPGSSHQHQDAE